MTGRGQGQGRFETELTPISAEATSARVALLLQKRGITRIHPLAGGIDAWLANNLPFERPEALKEAAAV